MPYTTQIWQLKNTIGALEGGIATKQAELERLSAARKSLVTYKNQLNERKMLIFKPAMSGDVTRGKARAFHAMRRKNLKTKHQFLVAMVQGMINAIDKKTSSLSSDISSARSTIKVSRTRMNMLELKQGKTTGG